MARVLAEETYFNGLVALVAELGGIVHDNGAACFLPRIPVSLVKSN